MGEVFRVKDIIKGRRKLIEQALYDLSPSVRDTVISILESWKGEESRDQLIKILGKKSVEDILKSLES
jgi:ribosome recycling factor